MGLSQENSLHDITYRDLGRAKKTNRANQDTSSDWNVDEQKENVMLWDPSIQDNQMRPENMQRKRPWDHGLPWDPVESGHLEEVGTAEGT